MEIGFIDTISCVAIGFEFITIIGLIILIVIGLQCGLIIATFAEKTMVKCQI